MTLITLPNTNVTGANLWSQVEDNDKAIRDVVNGSLDADNLANDAVTAAKLRDDASTDANRAVTTNHIRDEAVTTAKIGNAQVTAAKLGLTIQSQNGTSNASFAGNGAGINLPGIEMTVSAGLYLLVAAMDVVFTTGSTLAVSIFNNSLGGIGGFEYVNTASGTRIPVSATRIVNFTTSQTLYLNIGAGINGTYVEGTMYGSTTNLTALRIS